MMAKEVTPQCGGLFGKLGLCIDGDGGGRVLGFVGKEVHEKGGDSFRRGVYGDETRQRSSVRGSKEAADQRNPRHLIPYSPMNQVNLSLMG